MARASPSSASCPPASNILCRPIFGCRWRNWTKDERNNRQYHATDAIGRLRDGVTPEQASVELNTIAARLAQRYPATNRSIGVRVTPLRDALVGQLRPTLLALFASVALVLFIACANIANLLLVRASNRRREIAVRTALGATRARLLRQFLAESLVLSIFGSVAGVVLASAEHARAELRPRAHRRRSSSCWPNPSP